MTQPMAAQTGPRTRQASPFVSRGGHARLRRWMMAAVNAIAFSWQTPPQLAMPSAKTRQSSHRARQQCLHVATASACEWLKHFIAMGLRGLQSEHHGTELLRNGGLFS